MSIPILIVAFPDHVCVWEFESAQSRDLMFFTVRHKYKHSTDITTGKYVLNEDKSVQSIIVDDRDDCYVSEDLKRKMANARSVSPNASIIINSDREPAHKKIKRLISEGKRVEFLKGKEFGISP